MATVINNPSDGGAPVRDSGSSGLIIGIILAIVVLILFFAFLLPSMRGGAGSGGTSAPAPAMEGNGGGTTIQVPDKMEIDVNQK